MCTWETERGREIQRRQEHAMCYSLLLFTAADSHRLESSPWSRAMHTHIHTHSMWSLQLILFFVIWQAANMWHLNISNCSFYSFFSSSLEKQAFFLSIQIINKPWDRHKANNNIFLLKKFYIENKRTIRSLKHCISINSCQLLFPQVLGLSEISYAIFLSHQPLIVMNLTQMFPQ